MDDEQNIDKKTLKEMSKLLEEFEKNKDKMWTNDKIREMSTIEIIEKLNSFNVKFDKSEFLKQTENSISSEEITEKYYYSQPYTARDYDEDFIYMAIEVLWERLNSSKKTIEMINDLVYDSVIIPDENKKEIIDLGFEILNEISKFPLKYRSFEDIQNASPNCLIEFIEWIYDFKILLNNYIIDNGSYIDKGINFCEKIVNRFSDDILKVQYNSLLASLLYLKGEVQESRTMFEELISLYPKQSEIYLDYSFSFEEDLEDIYNLALKNDVELKFSIINNLTNYYEEKGEDEKAFLLKKKYADYDFDKELMTNDNYANWDDEEHIENMYDNIEEGANYDDVGDVPAKLEKLIIVEDTGNNIYVGKIVSKLSVYFIKEGSKSVLNMDKNQTLQYLIIRIESMICEFYYKDKSFNEEDLITVLNSFIKNPDLELDENFLPNRKIGMDTDYAEAFNIFKKILFKDFFLQDNFVLPNSIKFVEIKVYLRELFHLCFLKLFSENNTDISLKEFKYLLSEIIRIIHDRNWIKEENTYLDYLCAFYDFATEDEKRELKNKYYSYGKEYGVSNDSIKKIVSSFTTVGIDDNDIKPKVKVGRNDLCPCGSGKKYKKCCL